MTMYFFSPFFTSWLSIPVLRIKQAGWQWRHWSTNPAARLYQHRTTKYTNHHGATYSPRKYSQHTSPITFFQKHFFKLFWALSRGPRGYCPPFSNSPSHATYPQIFPHLSTSILTFFFTLFNLLMIIQPPLDRQSQTGVTNLWAVTHTWTLFFQSHPYA